MTDQVDLHFSFSARDNEMAGEGKGWVDKLISSLLADIASKSGRWPTHSTSNDLNDGQPEDELIDAARLLIPILSPLYICDSVRLADLKRARDRVVPPSLILGVQYIWLTQDQSVLFAQAIGADYRSAIEPVDFSPVEWGPQGRKQTDPFASSSKAYRDAISSLSAKISERLGRQSMGPGEHALPEASGGGYKVECFDKDAFKILLIYNLDDVPSRRCGERIFDELSRLPNVNLQILGNGDYRQAKDKQREVFEEALIHCEYFVQIVGENPGKRPDWASSGVVRYMSDRATDVRYRNDPTSIMRCRLFGEDSSLETIADEDVLYHKFLCDILEVQDGTESGFATAVRDGVAAAATRSAHQEPDPHHRYGMMIFTKQQDERFERLTDALQRHYGIVSAWPAMPGGTNDEAWATDKYRENWERQFLTNKAIVFLRNSDMPSSAEWLQTNVNYFQRLCSEKFTAETAPPGAVMCHSPPAQKMAVICRSRDVEPVNCLGVDCDETIGARIHGALEGQARKRAGQERL